MENTKTPKYYFDDYFRYVNPYEFTFNTNAKERWFGKSLLTIMKSEFLSYNETYFVY